MPDKENREHDEHVDLKLLTIKEHLILLNEKLKDIKEDTECLKSNDKKKWQAIRENELKISELYSSMKIYIAIFGIIFAGAVTMFWQFLANGS